MVMAVFFIGALSGCGSNNGAATTTTPTATTPTATTPTATAGTAAAVAAAATITISTPVFGVNPLSANGTTSVTVDVYADGTLISTPTVVVFASVCSALGKANIAPTGTTSSGSVTVSYIDSGCSGIDTVTASVGSVISSADLTVQTPAVGSIQFVGATPTTINLKGTGGVGLQETSRVQFKVVDAAGNAISGVTVNFSLSTSVGGITLISPTGVSDASGFAYANVSSGVVATPVRVKASVTQTSGTIQTQSDQLTITVGTPDQTSFSLSATKLNIEGWDYDGATTDLTARLSDHFNNPVPDGTTVNFVSEAAQIVGSCSIVSGACGVTLTSAGLRPTNGRVTVLAYAVGDESFIDFNGDGYVNAANERVSINGKPTDMPEAYVDFNENDAYDLLETFLDFNNNGAYDAADGVYNGILCNSATSTECPAGTANSIHVRGQTVIVMSSKDAIIDSYTSPAPIPNLGCNGTASFTFTVRDINDNPMPADTTITASITNGTVEAPSSFIVGSSSQDFYTSQNSSVFKYTVNLKGDGVLKLGVCEDSTLTGKLVIEVKTPGGSYGASTTTITNYSSIN